MVFLSPWASTLQVWKVFSFVNDFLFKSVFTFCDTIIQVKESKSISCQRRSEKIVRLVTLVPL